MIRILPAAILAICALPALACGPDTDCVIGERSYRIQMPEGHNGVTPVGAIVHAHGYKGTARGVMRNAALRRMASDLGVAFVAADAGRSDWVIPGAPRKTHVDGSREFAYFEALVEDVTGRFAIDPDRMMISGFSAGGMMVWTLACHRPGLFAGFAPVSGTFWAPIPQNCSGGPVNLIHTHGTSDKVVPLRGRPIADTHQGIVEDAFSLFIREGGFGEPVESRESDLICSRRSNPAGKLLELCLHPGGHTMRPKWLARAWRELHDAGAL